MFRKLTFAIAAVVLSSVVQNINAQSDEKKFEVGGQVSGLQLPARSSDASGPAFVLREDHETDYGFGARFGYNVSKYFALEAEVNFFPKDRELTGGKKVQSLFGVKAGKRFEKFGVFGKARPGFIRYEKGDYQFFGGPQIFPPPRSSFRPVTRTNFAFDLGGVIEFYPSKRTMIRFDAGDTIVHFDRRNVAVLQSNPAIFPTGLVVVVVPAETRHTLQASAGFGFRF